MRAAGLILAIAAVSLLAGVCDGQSNSASPATEDSTWDKAFLSPAQAELLDSMHAKQNATGNATGNGDGKDHENEEEDVLSTASVLSAVVVAFVGAAMANSAGVGGGAVFVPIFNLVMGEDLKHATAMSQVMVTAGALVGVYLNWPKSNPLNPERMLIEVDFVLLLMPAMLLGISIGVLFNVALQVWMQKLLMVALFSYLAKMTLAKGMKLFRKEMKTRKERKEQLLDDAAIYQALPAQEAEPRIAQGDTIAAVGGTQETAAGADAQAQRPERKVEWGSYGVLIGLWVVYFSFSLMHHTRPFCVRCSASFWALYAFMVILTGAITSGILLHLCKKHSHRRPNAPAANDEEGSVQHPLLNDDGPSAQAPAPAVDDDEIVDIDWSPHNLIKCTIVMLSAGVMAGFMGIGGGMIMSPLLLTLNVHPQVTAATSSLMVFFSSSAAFVQLALEGLIDPWYAVSFGMLAMVSSATGVLLIRKVIDRYGTTSIIVLVLGTFIAAAGLIILISGILEVDILDKSSFKMFNNICSPQGGSAEDDDDIDLATCFK